MVLAKSRRRIKRKEVQFGIGYICSTFNNTIITITDVVGNTVVWSSAGTAGFRGAKRSTSYAAQAAAESAAQRALSLGIRSLDLVLRGLGEGRDSSVKAFQAAGIRLLSIRDDTAIPHNGCRPAKRRRV